MKTYGQREFLLAYIDAQREPYPHEDFRVFRQKRLAALERLFRVRISSDTVVSSHRALFMLFSSTVRSYLDLWGRGRVLEAGLLERVIDAVDGPEVRIRETQGRIAELKNQCAEEQLALLDSLFSVMWRRLERTVDSADLAAIGFDDSAEPEEWDYYDFM